MSIKKEEDKKPSLINKSTIITAVSVAVVMSVVSVFTSSINQTATSYVKAPEEIRELKTKVGDMQKTLDEIKKELNLIVAQTKGSEQFTNKALVDIIKKLEELEKK